MKAKRKHLFKVFLIMLIVLSSLIESAFAHIPCQCKNPPDQCTCFIQLGDHGFAVELIICKLQAIGYLGKTDKKDEFTPEVKKAVIRFQTDYGLELTGWMDDETLNSLLYDTLPNPKSKYTEKQWFDICYVPTDGGQRYHTNPLCSEMYNPRLISRLNAERLGIGHCGRNSCPYYSSYQTDSYSSLHLTPRILPDEYYKEDDVEDNAGLSLIGEDLDDTVIDRSFPTDDIESVYIGNKNSHVFHSASCNSVKDMKEKNKIEFQSRDEAITNGYKPCSRCNP